jgi:hypothetical protein
MTNFKIKVSGSGTLQEIIDGLSRLSNDLSIELDNVYYDGQSYEDSTLMSEITEDNDIETNG